MFLNKTDYSFGGFFFSDDDDDDNDDDGGEEAPLLSLLWFEVRTVIHKIKHVGLE
jgi:hypothetical protein